MEWLNEPATWQRAGDVLTVTADAGTDFWRQTGYGYLRDSGHLYGEMCAGDLDLLVRVRGAFAAQCDQAGVMLRVDSRTWLKTGLEFFDGRLRLSTVITLGQSSWTVADLPPGTDHIALRVSRRGDAVEIRYRIGDGPAKLAALAYLPSGDTALAGVMCAAPDGPGFRVSFQGLRITDHAGQEPAPAADIPLEWAYQPEPDSPETSTEFTLTADPLDPAETGPLSWGDLASPDPVDADPLGLGDIGRLEPVDADPLGLGDAGQLGLPDVDPLGLGDAGQLSPFDADPLGLGDADRLGTGTSDSLGTGTGPADAGLSAPLPEPFAPAPLPDYRLHPGDASHEDLPDFRLYPEGPAPVALPDFGLPTSPAEPEGTGFGREPESPASGAAAGEFSVAAILAETFANGRDKPAGNGFSYFNPPTRGDDAAPGETGGERGPENMAPEPANTHDHAGLGEPATEHGEEGGSEPTANPDGFGQQTARAGADPEGTPAEPALESPANPGDEFDSTEPGDGPGHHPESDEALGDWLTALGESHSDELNGLGETAPPDPAGADPAGEATAAWHDHPGLTTATSLGGPDTLTDPTGMTEAPEPLWSAPPLAVDSDPAVTHHWPGPPLDTPGPEPATGNGYETTGASHTEPAEADSEIHVTWLDPPAETASAVPATPAEQPPDPADEWISLLTTDTHED